MNIKFIHDNILNNIDFLTKSWYYYKINIYININQKN